MKIIKSGDVKNHHIFALIVGASGIGKTSLVKTLPHDETLIISAESGLLSIKDSNIDVVEVTSYDELIDVCKFLKEENGYKNIFIDSLTELGEIVISELKPNYTKAQSFGLYEEYANKITNLLKFFRGLTSYNVYMTALDKMVTKDFTEVVGIDLVQKSLSKKIPALFDEVFYMQSIEHDGVLKRILGTNNNIVDFCKDRSGNLEQYELPDLTIINNKIFNKGEN